MQNDQTVHQISGRKTVEKIAGQKFVADNYHDAMSIAGRALYSLGFRDSITFENQVGRTMTYWQHIDSDFWNISVRILKSSRNVSVNINGIAILIGFDQIFPIDHDLIERLSVEN